MKETKVMFMEKRTILKIKAEDTQGNATLFVDSADLITTIRFTVCENGEDKSVDYSFVCNAKEASFPFYIDNVKLWSINNPCLYAYRAEITYGDGNTETVYGRFGLRILSADTKNVYVNGKAVFLRGYIRGARAHEHSNNCKLSEEEFYRKNILAAKKFGFNLVRFHSVVPSETFFNVADELGMLVHLELRSPNDEYNNLEEMLYGKKDLVADGFIKETVDRLYNHPSLAVYCIGNELKHTDNKNRVREIANLIKTLDDGRLFLDSSAWGAYNRDYVDIDVQHMSYYFPYAKHAGMYEDKDNLLVCGSADGSPVEKECDRSRITRSIFFNVPLIAHEVCHYTALRDFRALKEKFFKYGVPCPWWIDEELKMIEEKGFADNYERMYKASKLFQLECWKTAFEALRASNLLGGFHFLQFADTDVYENSNGVVDCFDDENYVTPSQFLRFNSDCVVLAEFKTRLFFGGERLCVPIKLSDYREKDNEFVTLSYALTGKNGRVYAEGSLEKTDIRRRGIYEICKIYLELPNVADSEELHFSVRLIDGAETVAENDWNLWVYARRNVGTYRDFCSYEKGDVAVTDDTERALQLLTQGKKVCLVYRQKWTRHLLDKAMPAPKYAFKATWNRFKPVIWDRGTNYGGLCNQALLEKYGFATSEYYDFNYSVLTEDCDKIVLDDFPVDIQPLISGTDKNVRDRFDAYKVSFNLPELQYDRTLRKFGYLFELQIGDGKLLVCGLNMTGLDDCEPSTVAMADWILRYLHSEDFCPEAKMETEALKAYMQSCAAQPVKERMMTQFWQLDDTPVESKAYWTESREYLLE